MKSLLKSIFRAFGLEIHRFENCAHEFYPRNLSVPQTAYETDSSFNARYDRAQLATQMTSSDNALRRQRHYTLYHLLRNLGPVPGDFCELGCWRGLSAYQTAEWIRDNYPERHFCIVDSFQGLSEYRSEDKTGTPHDHEAMRRILACPEDTVRRNLQEFPFVSFHRGWIPEQFHEISNQQFCWVHVDVDLYQPIKDSIDFLYPRLVKHGLMVFDDYGCSYFPGAKTAVDEFLDRLPDGEVFFLPLASGQAFLMKLV